MKRINWLTVAAVCACLALGGSAIGEEKKGKDVKPDPEVIQLDVPIQPSVIITETGIEHPNAGRQDKHTARRIKPSILERMNGRDIIQNRVQESQSSLKSVARKTGAEGEIWTPGARYPETSLFQSKDALKLEPEYITTLPPIKYDPLDIAIRQNEIQARLPGITREFPDLSLKWKDLGIRSIRKEKKRIWQTAVVDPGARATDLFVESLELPEGGGLVIYSLIDNNPEDISKPYILLYGPYHWGSGGTGSGGQWGDKVILEWTAPLPLERNQPQISVTVR